MYCNTIESGEEALLPLMGCQYGLQDNEPHVRGSVGLRIRCDTVFRWVHLQVHALTCLPCAPSCSCVACIFQQAQSI